MHREMTHEQSEEISELKATIQSMAHRQSELTSKTAGLKEEMHKLVGMQRQELNSFKGRLHGSLVCHVCVCCVCRACHASVCRVCGLCGVCLASPY